MLLFTKRDDRNLCGPRILAAMAQHSGDFYKLRTNIPKLELTADGGGDRILEILKKRYSKSGTQEAFTLWRDLWRGLSRQPGEGSLSWDSRFKTVISRVGAALHALDSSIDADKFMHPLIPGMMCGLEATEGAALLATSGGGQVSTAGQPTVPGGNSYLLNDLAESLVRQWSDEALV